MCDSVRQYQYIIVKKIKTLQKKKTFPPTSARTGQKTTWNRGVPAQHVGLLSPGSLSLWAYRVMRYMSSRDKAPTYIFVHFNPSLTWLRLEKEVLRC